MTAAYAACVRMTNIGSRMVLAADAARWHFTLAQRPS